MNVPHPTKAERLTHAKQERVIEAVRQGLEGLAAVEFIQKSGYAVTVPLIAKHLRAMGGRGHVQELIREGKSNVEIMESCFPEADLTHLRLDPPSQGELFGSAGGAHLPRGPRPENLYEVRKMAIKVPADLYEAIRLAARAEGVSQNELIVDVLTTALSRMPETPEDVDREP
jgi:hypothetical protein